ncbi:ABC-ATPase domain-containing protein [Actinoalloteichus spitiensis]|uniref:ABC-ATPase domain-containing protein n=1 Tax=Actinoalloteichus spitiensis TaxID=252394 RepID=UPI00068F720D|nr:ABC-ATPase domain-containing protein [Actinoalloteichus spitiensis]
MSRERATGDGRRRQGPPGRGRWPRPGGGSGPTGPSGPSRGGPPPTTRSGGQRGDAHELSDLLAESHGSGYGRYRAAEGEWDFGWFRLTLVRAQSDPYAPPSRLLVRIPASETGYPEESWRGPARSRALATYLLRHLRARVRNTPLHVDAGGQEVLDRSAGQVVDGGLVLRLAVDLPGHGRRIDGHGARDALCRRLPAALETLRWSALPHDEVLRAVETVEDAVWLRERLPELGLVAFVADGAVLPRRSGVDDRPLADAVPFQAPPELSRTVTLPNRGEVTGLGVPSGITVVVGGGYHGKSTLLRAVERGVYDHLPGDGRELVVARADTVKVRAEDGRSVRRLDVSAFVAHLPTGAPTNDFSTDNASGSTSQAAATVEALEAGAGVLLIDEDTAATNIMIRDARMQALVAKDKEPLTPFIDLVRPLHREHGVSTMLVMGGSGDYLDVADHVVMMDAYRPHEVTGRARELAHLSTGRRPEATGFPLPGARVVDPDSVNPEARGKRRLKARGLDALVFGEDEIDLRSVEQFVDPAQLVGVGLALEAAVRRGFLDGARTVAEALLLVERELLAGGPAELGPQYLGDFAVPRRFEVAAALGRLRALRIVSPR